MTQPSSPRKHELRPAHVRDNLTDLALASAFVIVTFAASIPIWRSDLLSSVEVLPSLPAAAIMTAVPGISALLVLSVIRRTDAWLDNLRLLLPMRRLAWRHSLAGAILPAAIVMLCGIVTLENGWGWSEIGIVRSISVVTAFLVAAAFEEMGWTSFLSERLVNVLGHVGTELTIGLVTACWHLPLLWVVRSEIDWIVFWFLGSIALRGVILELYFAADRSLWPAIFAHASYNTAWQFGPGGAESFDPAWSSIFLLVTWIAMTAYFGVLRDRNARTR